MVLEDTQAVEQGTGELATGKEDGIEGVACRSKIFD